MNIVEGLLRYRLQKWKLRCSEGRCDSGLLDPNQPVSCPNDCLRPQQIGQAHARSKIQPVHLTRSFRKPILAKEIELLSLKIENGSLVVGFLGRKIQRVAQARIDGQPPGGFPVVLNEI